METKSKCRMRIGLVDVDGHNFPNFALMRISAYHKSLGDQVEWVDPMFGGGYSIRIYALQFPALLGRTTAF